MIGVQTSVEDLSKEDQTKTARLRSVLAAPRSAGTTFAGIFRTKKAQEPKLGPEVPHMEDFDILRVSCVFRYSTGHI